MSIKEIKEERQKMLELVLVIVFVGLFINILATSLYSLFPQAVPWITVSSFALLFLILYFALVSRLLISNITETIPFVFAVNTRENYIPFFKLYGSPLSFASVYFRKIIEEKPEIKEKIETAKRDDTGFDREFFLDLTTFLIIHWLSFRHCMWWLFQRPLEYSFRRFESPIDKPSKKVERSYLLENLKRNIFSTLKDPQLFDMMLPPNTSIFIHEEKSKWSITMKNRYCKITIKISLFSWESFWNLEDVPVYFSSEERRREFDTFDFFINFEAKFSRILNFSPRMKDYYDWAEGMLERLRGDFDWRIQVQKIQTVMKALDVNRFAL